MRSNAGVTSVIVIRVGAVTVFVRSFAGEASIVAALTFRRPVGLNSTTNLMRCH